MCDIPINDTCRKFYITSNLPKTNEWRTYNASLKLSGKTYTTASINTHLQKWEADLRRDKGMEPGAAQFISKRGRGKKDSNSNSNSKRHYDVTCYGCGRNGHQKQDCQSKDK